MLLGFNELDLAGQANMTVELALDLWPQLQATGMRLGSPAPAYGAATPGSWFDRFMSGASQRGYRIDFSGQPTDPTDQQWAAFVTYSVAMLESLSFVERYAWFALPATKGMETGRYLNATTPTPAGAAYAQLRKYASLSRRTRWSRSGRLCQPARRRPR